MYVPNDHNLGDDCICMFVCGDGTDAAATRNCMLLANVCQWSWHGCRRGRCLCAVRHGFSQCRNIETWHWPRAMPGKLRKRAPLHVPKCILILKRRAQIQLMGMLP